MSLPPLSVPALEGAGLLYFQSQQGPVIRTIGTITADTTFEEDHHDTITKTRHPVQQGATISDHAFVNPRELTLRVGWSNSPVVKGGLAGIPSGIIAALNLPSAINSAIGLSNYINDIYAKLLAMQKLLEPITIQTGLGQTYVNMMLDAVDVTTDKDTAFALFVTIKTGEVIITTVNTVYVPPQAVQTLPEKTASPISNGTQQTTLKALSTLKPPTFLSIFGLGPQ